MRVAAVILAAGASTRFGNAKALAHFSGKTLLAYAIEAARGAGCEPVVVVSGAHDLREACAEVERVENEEWPRGPGTSIRCAVRHLLERDADQIILMSCDQPLVSAESLRRLIETEPAIAAAEYSGTIGVPARFARAAWPKLLELRDDEGAKRLLLTGDCARVPMPEAATDVDTPADLAQLHRGNEAES